MTNLEIIGLDWPMNASIKKIHFFQSILLIVMQPVPVPDPVIKAAIDKLG